VIHCWLVIKHEKSLSTGVSVVSNKTLLPKDSSELNSSSEVVNFSFHGNAE
jgi:hypothetical protein